MKKFGVLLALFALLSLAATAADYGQVAFINGHPMISLAVFSGQFGAAVGVDDARQAIFVSLGDRNVSFIPYSNTAWVNGSPVALDSPVVIVDGVTYIPLQFTCDAFGLSYNWENNNQQVVILNAFTGVPLIFYQDIGWASRRHVWRYNYSYNNYRHFRVAPFVRYGPPRGYRPPPRGTFPGYGRPPGYRPPSGGLPPGGGVRPGYRPPSGGLPPGGGLTPGYRPPSGGLTPGYRPPSGGLPPGGGLTPGYRPPSGGFRAPSGGGGFRAPSGGGGFRAPSGGGGRAPGGNGGGGRRGR